jgi:hypothetical protein
MCRCIYVYSTLPLSAETLRRVIKALALCSLSPIQAQIVDYYKSPLILEPQLQAQYGFCSCSVPHA